MTIDIRAQDSFSYPPGCCRPEMQQESVYMGHQKAIYLFFNLFSDTRELLQARLVLFKLPSVSPAANVCGRYMLYPLMEVFSVFNDPSSPLPIDLGQGVAFENPECGSYTEIDITKIAREWTSGTLENNGLLLIGQKDSSYVFYASGRYPIIGMRPVIRLSYRRRTLHRALQFVPCDVEVITKS